MTKTVLGVFSERQNAEDAINRLHEDGYDPKDISIVMKNREEGKKLEENTGADVAKGAVSGATTGLIIGGIAGLVASFVLPGIGAFFIGGPIASALGLGGAAATTVSGAATGALAGGLVGALMGFGLSEDEAKEYETQVNAGAILVAVPARTGEAQAVEDILSDCNATNVQSFTQEEREISRRSARQEDTRQFAYAGAKGGQTKTRSSSKGRGWHGDPKGHAIAGKGKDVPGR